MWLNEIYIMIWTLLFLSLGFFLLWKGGDLMVDGATGIARRLRIPDFIIGLTLIAFGTSAPELVVNVMASVTGKADIIFGNIIGSNIANTLFILGASAYVYPLFLDKALVIRDLPISFLVALITMGMLFFSGTEQVLTRGGGLILLAMFAVYLFYVVKRSKTTEIQDEVAAIEGKHHSLKVCIGLFIAGLLALPLGGHLVVKHASYLAVLMGISEAVVSLLLVAFGTSLPELAASLVAALKKKPDVVAGNIIGSNIFNVIFILGVSAVIRPLPFNRVLWPDWWIFLAFTLILFIFVTKNWSYTLKRRHGAFLFMSYFAYIFFCFLR